VQRDQSPATAQHRSDRVAIGMRQAQGEAVGREPLDGVRTAQAAERVGLAVDHIAPATQAGEHGRDLAGVQAGRGGLRQYLILRAASVQADDQARGLRIHAVQHDVPLRVAAELQ